MSINSVVSCALRSCTKTNDSTVSTQDVLTLWRFHMFSEELAPVNVTGEIRVRWWCIIHLVVNVSTMTLVSKLCFGRALVVCELDQGVPLPRSNIVDFFSNLQKLIMLTDTDFSFSHYIETICLSRFRKIPFVASLSLLATNMCKHLFTTLHCTWIIIHELKFSVYNCINYISFGLISTNSETASATIISGWYDECCVCSYIYTPSHTMWGTVVRVRQSAMPMLQ